MTRIKPIVATTVDAYLAALSPEDRAALATLRNLIRTTVPEAVECIEYKMPSYRLTGDLLVAFAAQKHYLCLYLCHPEILKAHANELKHLDKGKGCIRFQALDELPLVTVKKILHEAARAK